MGIFLMATINLHSCRRERVSPERHARHFLPSEQKDLEKIICQQSTNLFRNCYCTLDIPEIMKKYADSKSNLSIEYQLLKPNIHSYEQFLQVVFTTIHESALAKPAMLDFCLQLYANNNTSADIRNFAENYQAEGSIYWYTKESFVYRCINRTLRSGDIDKCYSLRFYIADLSAQIYTLKSQQQNLMKKSKMTILYRGFRQSDEELKILQGLIGRLVAVKSFMSTSQNKKIALTYASPYDGQTENSRPLLLEIYVDLSSPAIIAADIAGVSNFNEESEILFNFGSTFRVGWLTFDVSNNIWLCRFIATNENFTHILKLPRMSFNESLNRLISYGSDVVYSNETIQHDPGDSTSLEFSSNNQQKLSWLAYELIDWAYIRHIDCFIHWQHANIDKLLDTCQQALEIYAQADVKDSFDHLEIATYMNNVSYVSLLHGQHTQFITLLKSSLNIREKYLPIDHTLLAQSCRNLGLAYANLFDYQTAFQLHKRALNINQHASIATQWSTVTTLRNMGDLCHRSGNRTGAMKYYSKGMQIYYKCLNSFYPIKS